MSKNLVKLSAMALLVCGLGMVTACGDSEETPKTENNKPTNNMNECATGKVKATVDGTESCRTDCSTDETVCGATEMCATAGDKKVCVAKPAPECEAGKVKVGDVCLTDCSADANVCQANEECKVEGSNSVCRAKTVEPMPEATAPKCTDTPKPARCDADAATFTEWAPASVVNTFAIPNPDDDLCCFDFNGDDVADNGLGQALGLMPELLVSVNDGIGDSIASGSLALVLEHQGVDLTKDGDFSIFFLLGEPVGDLTAPKPEGNNEYKINPSSFEAGTYAQAVALAKLEAGKVVAGPGSVGLAIELFGATLNLTISSARVTADVDAANTGADKGVALNNGKLGGVIRVSSIFDALNTFSMDNCGCVAGLDGKGLISYDPNDLAQAACVEGADAAGCNADDQVQGICKTLVDDACGFVSLISTVAPDVNADKLGQDCLEPALGIECNAISIGAKLTAVGAKVTGVVEAAPGQ